MEKSLQSNKLLLKSGRVSKAALEKEIREFEDIAQQMLSRMDITLMTINGIANECDPTKRLEVRFIFQSTRDHDINRCKDNRFFFYRF